MSRIDETGDDVSADDRIRIVRHSFGSRDYVTMPGVTSKALAEALERREMAARRKAGDWMLRTPPGSPVKIKWQRVRFLNDNEIAMPRWVVVLTFVMLLVGLVHAAVTHG